MSAAEDDELKDEGPTPVRQRQGTLTVYNMSALTSFVNEKKDAAARAPASAQPSAPSALATRGSVVTFGETDDSGARVGTARRKARRRVSIDWFQSIFGGVREVACARSAHSADHCAHPLPPRILVT